LIEIGWSADGDSYHGAAAAAAGMAAGRRSIGRSEAVGILDAVVSDLIDVAFPLAEDAVET